MAVKLLKKDSLCRLVELGININSVDLHKKTPLHYAARMGNIEIGNLLVKLGAELNLLDYKGRTPAGLAENKEHFHFSDVLEKLGGKKINSYVTVNLQTVENTEISSLSEMNNELFKDMKVADRKYKHFYKQ